MNLLLDNDDNVSILSDVEDNDPICQMINNNNICNKYANHIYIYRRKIKIGEDENRGIYKYLEGPKIQLCDTHFKSITCDYRYNKLIYSKNNKLCAAIGPTIYAKK